ncbi:MAG TPA: DNA cytosine methyltransferase [Gaiellaceae bacterium]|nr:DNA cytosine methyltransferase [Gaiellaceae bacterium]
MDSAPAVVSLFSGGGGLDLGLELAGFETRVAVEWEAYACRTLRANAAARVRLPTGAYYLSACEILERSVRDVSGDELLAAAGLRTGEAAVLAGGPPCVTFSVAGRREGLQAETGRLFEDYVRLLETVQPCGLIFENVKGLINAVDEDGKRGGAFERIHSALEAAGYALTWRLVNAADYGVPQRRERVIILGLRGDRPPVFPEPTHYDPLGPQPLSASAPWRDVRAAIADLPPAARPGEAPAVPNHVARRHGEQVVQGFAATPPGKRNPAYKRDRLHWDRPAKVIRAQGKPKLDGSGQRHSSHQSIHPEEHRQLTVRECARIQTFPDWYVFPETFANGYRIVGDAVPVELARVLGDAMLREIQREQAALRYVA